MSHNEITSQLATAIAEMREMLAPIDEAALGYRRQLAEQGWSAAAAEQMAVAFHFGLTESGRQALADQLREAS